MIKTFLISMFAVFLFALGAAGAWYYMQMEKTKADEEAAIAAVSPPDLSNPIPKPAPGVVTDPATELPSAVRGQGLDAEQLYQMNTLAEAKRDELNRYEERLREHKARIKAGDADVKSAQREVEGALTQVRGLMDATEKLLGDVTQALENLQKQKADMTKKQEDLKAFEDNVGAGAAKNIKTFAEIIQSMPAGDAAKTVKEMWNDGKMDFAIQLLRNIEPRNVAKILAEVQDPQLVAELASRYPLAPQVR